MHVAALLAPRLLGRLRVIAGRDHHVMASASWPDLHSVVRRLPIDAAVVDPTATSGSHVENAREFRSAFPSLPVLIYVAPTAPALQTLVELTRFGFRDILVEGVEDDP